MITNKFGDFFRVTSGTSGDPVITSQLVVFIVAWSPASKRYTWRRKLYILCCLITPPRNGERGGVLSLNFGC